MSYHFIHVCSCGTVISQCRCPALDKTRIITVGACEKCREVRLAGGKLEVNT